MLIYSFFLYHNIRSIRLAHPYINLIVLFFANKSKEISRINNIVIILITDVAFQSVGISGSCPDCRSRYFLLFLEGKVIVDCHPSPLFCCTCL